MPARGAPRCPLAEGGRLLYARRGKEELFPLPHSREHAALRKLVLTLEVRSKGMSQEAQEMIGRSIGMFRREIDDLETALSLPGEDQADA